MKAILLLLIAIALVLTAEMRESQRSNPIGPADELIDIELMEEAEPQPAPETHEE